MTRAMSSPTPIEIECARRGLRLTAQRRVIARVLSAADDHPDVEELHARVAKLDATIALSTVYRTLKLFRDSGILARHDFGDGRGRFETAPTEHHDHLIDTASGRVIEFHSPEIEALQARVARELGYRLTGHRLELYGTPIAKDEA
jgi:Fur family transcriptional regulator, ferric uptake regulator